MSLSKEWTIWHLTPKGWIEGSSKKDFSPTREVDRPDDAVLSVEYREYQSCSFSKMDITKNIVWKSDIGDVIQSLLEKYGEAPDHL